MLWKSGEVLWPIRIKFNRHLTNEKKMATKRNTMYMYVGCLLSYVDPTAFEGGPMN